MKNRSFKLDLFIDQLEKDRSYTKDDQHRYKRMLKLIDHFFQYSDMDEDLLEEYSIEEFEWFNDLISYWPTWEMDCEREDLNHWGIQKEEIVDLMEAVGNLPQIRKKVTFI